MLQLQYSKDIKIRATSQADLDLIVQVLDRMNELHGILKGTMPISIMCIGSDASHADGVVRLPASPDVDVILHELGHLVDWIMMDDERARDRIWGTDLDNERLTDTDCELIQPWHTAMAKSALHARLTALQASASDLDERCHWSYFCASNELWARAYTQWVLQRTPQWAHMIDSYSKQEQDRWGELREGLAHWQDEDFTAIDAAMDALLRDERLEREQPHTMALAS